MAISLKKPLLVAVLEPVTMDAGMQFLLGTLQHIYRSNFDDSFSFVNALCQSRLLEESLSKTQAAAAIPMQTKDTRYHYPDGSVYTGSMKDGVPHGFGVRKWPNEEALERPLWAGESEEDYLRLLDPDIGGWSMMYEGEFDHSYAHGYGTLSWNNGTSYTGGFFRDLYHGHGSYSDTPFYWKGEYDHGDLISGSGYIRLGLEEWYRGELVSSETATPFSRQRVMPQGNGVLIRQHNGHATERPVSFPAKKR